jgi:hypothetical protein
VLGEELGIVTENTAKWLTDHRLKGAVFRPNQLVIVDEAALAGTFTLDQLAGLAAQAGAKMLLVGDWAQLQAVEAGGAFSLLAADRDDAPELFEIHRFRHAWEKAASLSLRLRLRLSWPDRSTAWDGVAAIRLLTKGPAMSSASRVARSAGRLGLESFE